MRTATDEKLSYDSVSSVSMSRDSKGKGPSTEGVLRRGLEEAILGCFGLAFLWLPWGIVVNRGQVGGPRNRRRGATRKRRSLQIS